LPQDLIEAVKAVIYQCRCATSSSDMWAITTIQELKTAAGVGVALLFHGEIWIILRPLPNS